MPSADQVPIKSTHSKMLWRMWVVLIAGSTGAALRAVRPPNRYVTAARPAVIALRRDSRGFLVAFVPGHHRPCHRWPCHGKADHGERAGCANSDHPECNN